MTDRNLLISVVTLTSLSFSTHSQTHNSVTKELPLHNPLQLPEYQGLVIFEDGPPIRLIETDTGLQALRADAVPGLGELNDAIMKDPLFGKKYPHVSQELTRLQSLEFNQCTGKHIGKLRQSETQSKKKTENLMVGPAAHLLPKMMISQHHELVLKPSYSVIQKAMPENYNTPEFEGRVTLARKFAVSEEQLAGTLPDVFLGPDNPLREPDELFALKYLKWLFYSHLKKINWCILNQPETVTVTLEVTLETQLSGFYDMTRTLAEHHTKEGGCLAGKPSHQIVESKRNSATGNSVIYLLDGKQRHLSCTTKFECTNYENVNLGPIRGRSCTAWEFVKYETWEELPDVTSKLEVTFNDDVTIALTGNLKGQLTHTEIIPFDSIQNYRFLHHQKKNVYNSYDTIFVNNVYRTKPLTTYDAVILSRVLQNTVKEL